MKIIEFKDTSASEWDMLVNKIPESTYLHTSWYINYLNAINEKAEPKSFIILDGNNPIAVCPVSVSKANNFGKEYMEATFKGFPSVYPAIIQLPATQRRRAAREVFNLIYERLKPSAVRRIELYRHPMNLGLLAGGIEPANTAEGLSFGYLCYIKNTIIINLKKDEGQLASEMSQYQRKHVKRAKERGMLIKEYRGDNPDIDKAFSDYQSAHFNSAGRLTRPLESWEIMKALLKRNNAALFVASTPDGIDISYLYCGEFDKFSFGWSQVNVDAYERQYSPRHLLEWEAMMAYKRRGFSYYEVGIKYDSPQLNYIPTEKEITISQFKERYGGAIYCCLYFEKIFDKGLFSAAYKNRLEGFLSKWSPEK